MQYPVGMAFNPDTARNEMVDFWAVATSPIAVNKFTHTILNSFVLGAVVVVGISSWYLKKKREEEFSRKSIKVASFFGLVSIIFLIWTGDGSAYQVAQKQPMKLAAMEGLYEGSEGTPLVMVGILNPRKYKAFKDHDSLGYKLEKPYLFNISIPKALSFLANRKLNSFVPGIADIINGGYQITDSSGKEVAAMSVQDRMISGKKAIKALASYSKAKEAGDSNNIVKYRNELDKNFHNFGYGYIHKPEDIVPNVSLVFYSFRIMVILGCYFLLFFILTIWLESKAIIGRSRWYQNLAIISIPLVYICSQAGWIVAEVGRQPWTIQDLLPVQASVSGVSASSVLTTVIIFFVLFSVLLAAELGIMFKVIRKGPAVN